MIMMKILKMFLYIYSNKQRILPHVHVLTYLNTQLIN